jgi:hypothetical protein
MLSESSNTRKLIERVLLGFPPNEQNNVMKVVAEIGEFGMDSAYWYPFLMAYKLCATMAAVVAAAASRGAEPIRQLIDGFETSRKRSHDDVVQVANACGAAANEARAAVREATQATKNAIDIATSEIAKAAQAEYVTFAQKAAGEVQARTQAAVRETIKEEIESGALAIAVKAMMVQVVGDIANRYAKTFLIAMVILLIAVFVGGLTVGRAWGGTSHGPAVTAVHVKK